MSLKKLVDQIKKEQKEKSKTTAERFVEKIEAFLVEKGGTHTKRKAHNPSSYYKCMRAKWYELKDVPTTDGKVYARSQMILGVGTALHEWIQSILIEMDKAGAGVKLIPPEELPSYGQSGFEIIREHSASPMEIKFLDTRHTTIYPISAMVDGAIEVDGQTFIFEFKTINPQDFEYLFEPLQEHIKQGAMYALSTGIRNVIFLYMDKGSQRLKPFQVTYTDGQIDWVRNRLQTLEQYIVHDELPPKEESDQCKWCSYRSLCAKDAKHYGG